MKGIRFACEENLIDLLVSIRLACARGQIDL